MKTCRSQTTLSRKTTLDLIVDVGNGEENPDGPPDLDGIVKWLVHRSRKYEDNRFVEHGTDNCTALYGKFQKEKEKVVDHRRRHGRGMLIVRTFYDTRSYNCRDLPSMKPGALKLLFQYYCRLMQPTGGGSASMASQNGGITYDMIQVANETMSLSELTIFVSNFKLVPDIISHAGVHFAWQRQRRSRKNDPNPTELDYRSFVEVMVRIALIAFPHHADPLERVRELARFLDLENTPKYGKMLQALEKSRGSKARSTNLITQDGNGFQLSSGRKKRWRIINPHFEDEEEEEEKKKNETEEISISKKEKITNPYLTAKPNAKDDEKKIKMRKMFWQADALFEPSLMDELEQYEFTRDRILWLEYDDEFVDMGVLVKNSSHVFKMEIQNMASLTTAMTIDFENVPDCQITYEQREMAMGIARTAIIKVTCKTAGEFVGKITIKLNDREDNIVDSRVIPVYLHVIEPTVDDDMSRKGSIYPYQHLEENEDQGEHTIAEDEESKWDPFDRRNTSRNGSVLHHHHHQSPMAMSPKQWTRSKSIISGLSLPSPNVRLKSAQETIKKDVVSFERKPLPLSLVPERKDTRQSLSRKRVSISFLMKDRRPSTAY